MLQEKIEINCIFPLFASDHGVEFHHREFQEARCPETSEYDLLSCQTDLLIVIECPRIVHDTPSYTIDRDVDLILYLELSSSPVLLIILRYIISVLSDASDQICKSSLTSPREPIKVNTLSMSEMQCYGSTSSQEVSTRKILKKRSERPLGITENSCCDVIEDYRTHDLERVRLAISEQ